jgi:hypothetical protein
MCVLRRKHYPTPINTQDKRTTLVVLVGTAVKRCSIESYLFQFGNTHASVITDVILVYKYFSEQYN